MQPAPLDDPQADPTERALGVALDPRAPAGSPRDAGHRAGGPSAAAVLRDTLAYLTSLHEQLWRSVHSLPAALPDGATPAVARVRRARQAAAIQGAVEVLRELSRETYPPLPGQPTP